ncbi:hypothetical protein H8D30_04745 [bacterium]|nr:hypothetical protein [bacterium]
MTKERTPCPYCQEPILRGANLCPHCQSWLIEGGKASVDALNWAEGKKDEAFRTLKSEDWDEAIALFSRIVTKAPLVPWAKEGLEKAEAGTIKEKESLGKEALGDTAEECARSIVAIRPEHKWAKRFLEERAQERRAQAENRVESEARKAQKRGDWDTVLQKAREALGMGMNAPWIVEMRVLAGERPLSSIPVENVIVVLATGDHGWALGLSSGELILLSQDKGHLSEIARARAHKGGIIAMCHGDDGLLSLGLDEKVVLWDSTICVEKEVFEIEGIPISIAWGDGSCWLGMLDGRLLRRKGSGWEEVGECEGGLNHLFGQESGVLAVDDGGQLVSFPEKKVLHQFPQSGIRIGSKKMVSTIDGTLWEDEGQGWKGFSLPSVALEVAEGSGLGVVAGAFGVQIVGADAFRLGTGSATAFGMRGSHLLVARTTGLELWDISRWKDS